MLKKKEAKRLAEYLTTVSVGKTATEKALIAEVVQEVVAVGVKDKHKALFDHLLKVRFDTMLAPAEAAEVGKEQIGGGSADV